jgi:hypothetical protein
VKHIENTLGTGVKWKKTFPLPSPPPNLKGEKASHHECMFGPSHWLHEITLSIRVHHYFWPGLMPLQFTLKSILMQKKNYGNSNISPCKNIIFKKIL